MKYMINITLTYSKLYGGYRLSLQKVDVSLRNEDTSRAAALYCNIHIKFLDQTTKQTLNCFGQFQVSWHVLRLDSANCFIFTEPARLRRLTNNLLDYVQTYFCAVMGSILGCLKLGPQGKCV